MNLNISEYSLKINESVDANNTTPPNIHVQVRHLFIDIFLCEDDIVVIFHKFLARRFIENMARLTTF